MYLDSIQIVQFHYTNFHKLQDFSNSVFVQLS